VRPPGHWLRAAAGRVCAKRTIERVVDPIVTDIQTEYVAAARTGHRVYAEWTRVCGYTTFWKAIGVYTLRSGPRGLLNSLAGDHWALARLIVYSLTTCVAVTLVLSASPMIATYSRFPSLTLTMLLLPQAFTISIPIALSLAIACSGHRIARRVRRVRRVLSLAAVATLLSFASVLTLPMSNQAYRVAMAQQLGLRGITAYSLPRGMNELSLTELAVRSHEYSRAWQWEKVRRFDYAYHLRLALPTATFVLSLFGLALGALARNRASRFLSMAVVLAGYYVALMLAESKWSIAMLPPIVSVWAPNVVFTALSLALLTASGDHRRSLTS
jgi:hypothetical protein